MKKTALLLAIILVISMPLSVFAEPRALEINPALGFEGTTAICETSVVGNNTSEYIEVTMKLKWGIFTLETWTASGYGYVYMLEEHAVNKGWTYKLVVEVTFDGVEKTPVSVEGTC